MNIQFVLLIVLFGFLLGVLPMLLIIPVNGLTIWGQILATIGIPDHALYIWFFLTALLIILLLAIKLLRGKTISISDINMVLKLFKPWAVFCAYLLINYLLFSSNGGNPQYSSKKVILFVIRGIAPAFLISVWLLLNNKNTVEKLQKVLVGFGIIQSYLVIQSYLSGEAFRSILGLNPIWLARELGLSALASLTTFKNKLKFLLVSLFIFNIILTRSRGPLIALIITLFIVYLYKSLMIRKYGNLALISVLILGSVFLLLLGIGMDEYFIRGEASFFEETNVSSRVALYKSAWNDFIESPILGKGIGNYNHYRHSYPHNIILELLAETGLLGLALFFIALKPKNMFRFKNTFSVHMLFALITTLFSGDLAGNSYLVVFSILASLLHMRKKRIEIPSGV